MPLSPFSPQLQLDRLSNESVLGYFDEGLTLTEKLFSTLLDNSVLLKAPDHRKSSPNSDTAGVACCPAIHFQLYWGNRNIT